MPTKADIWMPLYIGDYLADTSHLDAERHGCYLLWMMRYWRKGPLPDDLPDLVNSGRLIGTNAPSIAQALLNEFFTKNGDGLWHQKRQDIEIVKWQGKKLKAQEKATAAAAARWGKDAPSNASGNASSTPQAVLTPCPLPLPSSLPSSLPLTPPQPKENPKKQNTSHKPKKDPDPRHTLFKKLLSEYWKYKNPTNPEMPWDKPDAGQLGNLLKASPNLTVEQFRSLLRNRAKSEVAHGDRVHTWLANITKFSEPINQYGRPKNGNGGKYATVPNGTGNSIVGAVQKSLEGTECEDSSWEDGNMPSSVEAGRGDVGGVHAGSSQFRLASISGSDEKYLEF